MNTNKIIGIILIVGGLIAAFLGVNKVTGSTKSVSALGVEISASDNSAKTEGFIYLGLGALMLVGGVMVVKK